MAKDKSKSDGKKPSSAKHGSAKHGSAKTKLKSKKGSHGDSSLDLSLSGSHSPFPPMVRMIATTPPICWGKVKTIWEPPQKIKLSS